MTEGTAGAFPRIPASSWWQIRRRFINRIPGTVDGSYLSAFLPMNQNSARKNIVGPLRTIGFIDEEGKPTDRAVRWRTDAQYPAVCQEIRESVYPDGLLDAFPEPPIDRQAVENWFVNNTRVGLGAARQMAAFYILLLEADPVKQDDAPTTAGQSRTTKPVRENTRRTDQKGKSADVSGDGNASSDGSGTHVSTSGQQQGTRNEGFTPSLHIDVQVHISPEASPEQIDAIFASMAKHLYKSEGA